MKEWRKLYFPNGVVEREGKFPLGDFFRLIAISEYLS
jgi:hypothetical protein